MSHLLGRSQVELRVGTAKLVGVVQGRAVVNGNQHILQPVPLLQVVVDIAGGDVAQFLLFRQGNQPVNALHIAIDQVC